VQFSTEEERVKVVITIPHNSQGTHYTVGLFEGNCGPDRMMVVRLETIRNFEADPYRSIT
jgi:hypothetical protein